MVGGGDPAMHEGGERIIGKYLSPDERVERKLVRGYERLKMEADMHSMLRLQVDNGPGSQNKRPYVTVARELVDHAPEGRSLCSIVSFVRCITSTC